MRAKKSLGQHFLSSPHYLNAIAEAGAVLKGDLVLEVGPGKGTLTAELLSRGARVIAVEKDDRLIAPLRERFATEAKQKRFTLVHGDILEADLAKLTAKKPYKVVANVPYYISGALIRLFLEAKHQPAHMALLLQKEVVERIACRERSRTARCKESLLSLSVKAYGTPRYIKKVPAGAFSPPPKVDSAILAISGISRANFKNMAQEERFFALLHAGFAHKRKVIGGKLAPILGKSGEKALRSGLAKKRAEDVPLSVWLALAA